MTIRRLRLGLNIDHVATVRNARGGAHPDPLRAALLAKSAGVDSITAHLREDRRHIRDADVAQLMNDVGLPLNLEMAPTAEMVGIATKHAPHAVCLVPENREEITTEGGLEVAGLQDRLGPMVRQLMSAGCRVSLFIEADIAQLKAAAALGVPVVELHTGRYCEAKGASRSLELERIRSSAKEAALLGLECHAGHGLAFDNVKPIAAIPEIVELNIGHFLIGEAVFIGLKEAISEMRHLMDEAMAVS